MAALRLQYFFIFSQIVQANRTNVVFDELDVFLAHNVDVKPGKRNFHLFVAINQFAAHENRQKFLLNWGLELLMTPGIYDGVKNWCFANGNLCAKSV
jgi:hypothetical protein